MQSTQIIRGLQLVQSVIEVDLIILIGLNRSKSETRNDS